MIDPSIEKALAPTRESWKTNVYQSKLFAFITSGWLAVFIIGILLAIVYVLLKVPPLAPQTELPSTAVVAPVQNQFVEPNKKVVKPTVKKAEAKPVVKENLTTQKPKPIDLSPIDTAPIPPSPPFPSN